MTIIGQPKTTAQYIQVSGRVGRRADISPGLVLTIYGAAKPRDRSHYERFRTYQQLYAQVEPTSVTPFATPVLRRARSTPLPWRASDRWRLALNRIVPRAEYEAAVALLRERADFVEPTEVAAFDQMALTRPRQWNRWERTSTWEANAIGGDPEQGLMRFAGTLPDLESKRRSGTCLRACGTSTPNAA